jgi:hypothetical protein
MHPEYVPFPQWGLLGTVRPLIPKVYCNPAGSVLTPLRAVAHLILKSTSQGAAIFTYLPQENPKEKGQMCSRQLIVEEPG